jgi:hypothetical protein
MAFYPFRIAVDQARRDVYLLFFFDNCDYIQYY